MQPGSFQPSEFDGFGDRERLSDRRIALVALGLVAAACVTLVSLVVSRGCQRPEVESASPAVPGMPGKEAHLAQSLAPIRPIPERFRRDSHMPAKGEGEASGSIDLGTFSAGRDLVFVDDSRVWWESDNDSDDTECDHSMHRAMELPLRRLVELVAEHGGTLKVQDSYRASGVHSDRSLHKEGRGIDVTCDELGLEKLARLCWAAGFDWVYYEASSRGGAHVHCSVRRDG